MAAKGDGDAKSEIYMDPSPRQKTPGIRDFRKTQHAPETILQLLSAAESDLGAGWSSGPAATCALRNSSTMR